MESRVTSYSEQDRIIPNVKAYKLLDEGKSPLEVTAELNLPGPQVQQYYGEYLEFEENAQACCHISGNSR